MRASSLSPGPRTENRSTFTSPANCRPACFASMFKRGQRTLWKELMPTDPAGVENIGPILMTADAKTCVFGYHRMLADLYLVEGLK